MQVPVRGGLYEVGCKGPVTFSPCPTIKWNLGTSFCIDSGHPCIGCTRVVIDPLTRIEGPRGAPRPIN